MSGACRAVGVVGAAACIALLSAGVASAAGPVQLKSRLGDWCLDGPNGATVVNACNGSSSQRWDLNSGGLIRSGADPGQCLSIGSGVDDTPVTVAPCQTNANNQRWTVQANGQITSALGPCLNVSGGVAQPGTPVIAYHCIADVADEQWDSAA